MEVSNPNANREKEVREIALPGELLGERKGRKLGAFVYETQGKVYSKVLGVKKVSDVLIDVIPLAGKYIPKVGDRVVGRISSVEVSGWFVDINSPYVAYLPIGLAVEGFVDLTKTDISKFFDVGDLMVCVVSKVSKDKTVQVSLRDPYARRLEGGTVIEITPAKVARVVGRKGSMINLLKKKTGCQIIPGQNGVVWIKGEQTHKAIEAILQIEKESHIYGLTEKIEKMLEHAKS